ncbi:MAG: hypothetical protein KAV45_00055 [Calditrichia bacterium]|nr:hypothetical protein [Calditrichia bacterium]
MRLKSNIIVLIVIIGLTGIRLAILIDDPEHLIVPDPDCPICQAYQSQVLLVSNADLTSLSTLLLYFKEQTTIDSYSHPVDPILSIRAPPIS